MNIEGGCFCGHVTYRAVINPDTVAICHCTDCQRHAASAYGVVVGIVDEQFELLSGELKVYVKTADSGTKRGLAFCPECGTRIYAKTVGEGSSFFGLRTGTIDQRDQLRPSRQLWCRSAQPWAMDISGISKIETQPA